MNTAIRSNIIPLNRERRERTDNCQSCSKKGVCPAAAEAAGTDLADSPHQRVIKAGNTVYQADSPFEGIYIVRSGFFKSYTIDADGAMQVTGFHLPGELFGMDGIEDGSHREYVEALDTSSICRISLKALTAPAASSDVQERSGPSSLMLYLVKLLSRTISRDHEMFFTLGKMAAKRRLGAFLLDLSRRMAGGGYSGTHFRLCMSRTDIANYLCLAGETVSRVLTQLQAEGTIEVNHRELRINSMEALNRDEMNTLPQTRGSLALHQDGLARQGF